MFVVGCVEALAEERALLLCYWLVHRPPGPTPLLLALRLLHALAITPPAAWAAAAQGGVVYLLTVLLPAKPATPDLKVPSMGPHPVFSCTAFALPLHPYVCFAPTSLRLLCPYTSTPYTSMPALPADLRSFNTNTDSSCLPGVVRIC